MDNNWNYISEFKKCLILKSWNSKDTNVLTRANFKDRSTEPPPHIRNTLWEVVGKSPLLKGWNAVGDNVPDFGQVSKVVTHVDHKAELKLKGNIFKQGLIRPNVLPKSDSPNVDFGVIITTDILHVLKRRRESLCASRALHNGYSVVCYVFIWVCM